MMGGFGIGFMGIFWIGVAILIALVARGYFQDKKGPENTGNIPLDILKQRYAKGEISKEEYEERKKDLI